MQHRVKPRRLIRRASTRTRSARWRRQFIGYCKRDSRRVCIKRSLLYCEHKWSSIGGHYKRRTGHYKRCSLLSKNSVPGQNGHYNRLATISMDTISGVYCIIIFLNYQTTHFASWPRPHFIDMYQNVIAPKTTLICRLKLACDLLIVHRSNKPYQK